MQVKKKRIIIDCDPGIDDALAILLAINSPEIEVVGITVVGGNVDAMKCAMNAIKVLEVGDRLDIPVYLGESKPLVRDLVTAEETHGKSGLGSVLVERNKNHDLIREGAIDFLLENSENTHLLTIGPMINLAKAIEKDKVKFNRFLSITSMGGTFRSNGNCSQVAEFNYWVDPHAVQIVYDNYDKLITMVGLDVTRKCVLTPTHRQLLKFIDTKLSRFIYDITEFYVDFHWDQERTMGCVINDPLAMAYIIDDTMATGFSSNLEMVLDGNAIGQSMIDIQGFYKRENNVVVLTKVDEIKFMNMFFSRLFSKHKKDIDIIIGKS
ncbi:MAG: nucleoside hydrolase [Psychrilyobacter sp.]|nr:nucleoside hydrolase [Psychrilyobacter sp.]